ncbi:MAG TPA: type II/IV secretion system protein [Candidatus Acidoferrales bacterium]|nr:type II/IV secretion system protein [Candidatus Acidoferrales bacterium]
MATSGSQENGERAILRFLQRNGRLSAADAVRFENTVANTGIAVYELLEREGVINQSELAELLAQSLRLPLVKPTALPIDNEVVRVVKEAVAFRCKIAPLRVDERTIEIATANPLDMEAIRALEFATGRRPRLAVATYAEIQEALKHTYRLEESLDQFLKTVPAPERLDVREVDDDMKDVRSSIRDAELAPVVRLTDLILAESIRSGASDAHIEPNNEGIAVRYRIDGVLEERFTFPKWVQNPLLSRLKVLAKLDITERRVPQDGRIQVRYREGLVDFRVSSLPAQHGEKITMRVLDATTGLKAVSEIGFSEFDLQRARNALAKPEGLILVTGPTGSGKTTTLYSFLREMFSTTRNMVTIENPIEYQLRGITQVEVNPKQGLTFASVLRSILRQDPDVILVGEIRDAETAQIAMQAAQTGHLVLSTLHTNDSATTITRLADLGVEPYSIASSLNLVVAQRLVRRVCTSCGAPSEVSETARRVLRIDPSVTHIRRGAGCSECRQTGFRGRIGVYEMLPVSSAMARLIEIGSHESALRQQARADGCASLTEDAVAKIVAGITTPEEVLRVVQVTDSPPTPVAMTAAPTPSGVITSSATHYSTQAIPPPQVRTHKALVVDDDPDLRRIVRTMLERSGLGLTVITAQDGTEALSMVDIERPDIVVLDVAMPGMDGFEVCRRMRADPMTAGVPVLLLTARDTTEDVARGFREGADDYVVKPFRSEELVARIRRMIHRTYGELNDTPNSVETQRSIRVAE